MCSQVKIGGKFVSFSHKTQSSISCCFLANIQPQVVFLNIAVFHDQQLGVQEFETQRHIGSALILVCLVQKIADCIDQRFMSNHIKKKIPKNVEGCIQGWQCQKLQKLGTCTRMAVRTQDKAYKDYTSNPIPTSCYPSAGYTMRLLGTALMVKKKRCRDGSEFIRSVPLHFSAEECWRYIRLVIFA